MRIKQNQAGPSVRQRKVAEEIRHALAGIFGHGGFYPRDVAPEIARIPITCTEVRISPDLRHATVFVMPLGGQEQKAVVEALNQAAPHLRHLVVQEVELRLAPTLRFLPDESFAEAEKIEKLLKNVKKEEVI
ncbi:MAG: 30S ribosome-binding factor RbfA [Dongiaceae bacterium]